MEDLKENTQKKNMKKLVLSVTLGMFCYCSNSVTMRSSTAQLGENNNNNNITLEKGEANQTGGDKEEKATLLVSQNPTTNQNIQEIINIPEPTKIEKKDEECCPCCCCHYKESKGKEGEGKEKENTNSGEQGKGIQLSEIKEGEQGDEEKADE